jgi:hypothetical protein
MPMKNEHSTFLSSTAVMFGYEQLIAHYAIFR